MKTNLKCRCGETSFEVTGTPILSCDCACESCRRAAEQFSRLRGGFEPGGPSGTTHFVMYRKDRVACLSGSGVLAAHHLTKDSTTRRVVATCCDTPVFLEFQGGHWLSLYAGMWPRGACPSAELRTMVSDLPEEDELPGDIPNVRSHSIRFMWRLAIAWFAMGFRAPAIEYVQGGDVDV